MPAISHHGAAVLAAIRYCSVLPCRADDELSHACFVAFVHCYFCPPEPEDRTVWGRGFTPNYTQRKTFTAVRFAFFPSLPWVMGVAGVDNGCFAYPAVPLHESCRNSVTRVWLGVDFNFENSLSKYEQRAGELVWQ